MVIIVKQNTKEERIRELIQWIESQNLRHPHPPLAIFPRSSV